MYICNHTNVSWRPQHKELPDCSLKRSAVLRRSFQLERLGYFCVDPDSTPGHLVLNRTCMLKDSFAAERRAPAKGR